MNNHGSLDGSWMALRCRKAKRFREYVNWDLNESSWISSTGMGIPIWQVCPKVKYIGENGEDALNSPYHPYPIFKQTRLGQQRLGISLFYDVNGLRWRQRIKVKVGLVGPHKHLRGLLPDGSKPKTMQMPQQLLPCPHKFHWLSSALWDLAILHVQKRCCTRHRD